MAKETIDVLVDGGKASAGPPLGPALGPTGLKIADVVNEINKKTAEFEGMKIPVKVIIDTDTKTFEIKTGSPPTSALIKKELGLEKGSGTIAPVGNLTIAQAKKVAEMKKDSLLANDIKAAIKEVIGVCRTMGITIEGMTPKEATKAIDSGQLKY